MFIPLELQHKFTSRALKVVTHAAADTPVSLIDLVTLIYDEQGSLGSNFLKSQDISRGDLERIKALIQPTVAGVYGADSNRSTGAIRSALKKAVAVAARYRHYFIGTQHLLFGVFDELTRQSGLGATVATALSLESLQRSLRAILESTSHFPNLEDIDVVYLNQQDVTERLNDGPFESAVRPVATEKPDVKLLKRPGGSKFGLPPQFGQDLTARARNGELDPLIGREPEVDRLIQVLCRRTKSNPLLIGESGVGKTAIVQGLAQRIVQGTVPAALANKRIYDLRLSLLVAGTMFRGEFEARLEGVVQEAKRNDVILFIDEIHNIVGAGSAQGSLDAANILKPPLAQGEIQVIGATTLEEYRRYIERDKALARRFQSILVREPDEASSREILRGLRGVYETYHNVRITEEAITSAVELSSRHILDRFLPDKAIDLIDEAAARARSRRLQTQDVIEVRRLKEVLIECAVKKEHEIERAAYDQAFEIKNQEKALRERIAALEQSIAVEERSRPVRIGAEHVERVVAEMTGVPVERVNQAEGRRLKHLERDLSHYIVGQERAVSSVARAIRRARAGLKPAQRPLGSFLFMGPTGVGKTELSRRLAEHVFGPDALVKLDMSEFMEPHSVSRLLGAPAGYVGYGDSGQLTRVIHQPYAVVLFDEIEKAHPQVHNILLQILEDGRVTDATGRQIDFKNTIIILTSNIGTARFTERAALGFGSRLEQRSSDTTLLSDFKAIEQEALQELRETLRPELLDRLDEVIVFQALGRQHIRVIVSRYLAELKKRFLDNSGADLVVAKGVVDYLTTKSFQPRQGARLVRRVIENVIEDKIAAVLIDRRPVAGQRLAIRLARGEPVVKVE